MAKKMKNKNDNDNKDNKVIQDEENKMVVEKNINEDLSVEDIFNNKVLKYENTNNPIGNDKQNKIVFITDKINQYEPLSERIKK